MNWDWILLLKIFGALALVSFVGISVFIWLIVSVMNNWH